MRFNSLESLSKRDVFFVVVFIVSVLSIVIFLFWWDPLVYRNRLLQEPSFIEPQVTGNVADFNRNYNYTYADNGYLVTKSSNGTIIKQERLTGLFRNSSVTTYYEYRGLATIRYLHTPRNYVTYQQITNESRDADIIMVSSLLENVMKQPFINVNRQPNPYNITYNLLLQGDDYIIVKGLRSDESKSFKFFNRTFTGRVEVTASLISLDTADMTYEVRDLKIVVGSTQHKFIVEWKWLILQEQKSDGF